jgi:hypothetical protein
MAIDPTPQISIPRSLLLVIGAATARTRSQ